MTKKIIKKGISALALSTVFTMAAAQSFIVNAEESNSTTKVGTAYLEAGSDIKLAGEAIYADGQYDMTWEVSDASVINDADAVRLVIYNEDPYPLGVKDELSLSVDEVWVDGVKLDETLHGEPVYAVAMDYIYSSNEITQIQYLLRGASFNDLDVEINEDIKVVFTLSNVTNPEEYSVPTKTPQVTGDVNSDGTIDAIDASLILTEYAKSATGNKLNFSAVQKISADVNKDGEIDAIDASLVLGYYAYKATGGTMSMDEFLK